MDDISQPLYSEASKDTCANWNLSVVYDYKDTQLFGVCRKKLLLEGIL